MQTVFEVAEADAGPLIEIAEASPSECLMAEADGIDGETWLTFVANMSGVIAPQVTAVLLVLIAQKKKVVVIENGKRRDATEEEVKNLADKSGE